MFMQAKERERVASDEIKGALEREALLGKKRNSLSKTQKRRLLRSKTITTEKFKSGVFERLKAQLARLRDYLLGHRVP